MDEAVTFPNFAYGSNMLAARLRERVSSARPVGTACLPGFPLRWHKVSVDGAGKCDVVEDATPGECVWGVVFAIESAQKDSLDKAEGLGNGYGNREVSVMLGGATLTAQAYVATRTDAAYLPYDWYRALVVAGAREHALPPDYVAVLEAQPCTVDTNEERRRMELGLTQPEVAKILGVSSATVLGWERRGRIPVVGQFPAVIRFLGCDPTPTSDPLPDRLLAKRRDQGWSIREAAARFGVDESTWGYWEAGGAPGDRSNGAECRDACAVGRGSRHPLSVSLQAVTADLSIGTSDPFIVSPVQCRAGVRQQHRRFLAQTGS